MSSVLQGHSAPTKHDLVGLAKAWDYALEDIPLHHFEALFHRAVKAKRDSYPLSAIDMLREWDDLKNELLTQGQQHAADVDRQLMAGHGSVFGRMHLDEWKALHNLPAEAKLGDPFPPESDLYGKEVPPRHEDRIVSCQRCKGARWLRIPADIARQQLPRSVRCPDCY